MQANTSPAITQATAVFRSALSAIGKTEGAALAWDSAGRYVAGWSVSLLT